MGSRERENNQTILEIDLTSLPEQTLAEDGRLSLKELYQSFDELLKAGWTGQQISHQEILVEGEEIAIPIFAFFSPACQEKENLGAIVISGIHGTEPAGPNALAQYIEPLIEIGKQESFLLMPSCNPWGYHNDKRMSPNGESVTDSEHCLGMRDEPLSREADEITTFLMELGERIDSGTKVLDLHEDDFREDPKRETDSVGIYLYIYIHGEEPEKNPLALAIVKILQDNLHPIITEGTTRFGEKIVNGLVINSKDGSIDHLLFEKLGAGLGIVLETHVIDLDDPPLGERVNTHREALNIFFGRK